MTRRILSILLTLCLLAGLLPFGTLAVQEDFSDVPAAAWYAADVDYAVEHGLMVGVGDGKFDPNGTTTRAMLVTILHRLEGKPAAVRSAFADVPAGEWYTAAVDWAAANKIVEGMDAATFAPASPVTREQFAAILYRYANFKGMDTAKKADLSAFADAGKVSRWAADAMAWANATGLIQGVGKSSLDPAGNATRAQAAAILHRFDLLKQEAAPTEAPSETPVPDTPTKQPEPTVPPTAKPGELTLAVDKTDATVTEPKQTFTGSYTVENDQIDRIDWVQHSDVEAYEGIAGTAMIDQTKGTWQAADILLAPGENTITFTAYTKTGAKAEQTVKIAYDSGEVAGYTNSDITYIDDQGNGYVNNVILVVLDVEASEAEKEAAIQAVCEAVGGEVIGQLNGCAMYQIRVPEGDEEALISLCRTAETTSDLVLSADLDRVFPEPAVPVITGVKDDGSVIEPSAETLSVPDREPVYPNDAWDNSIWSETIPSAWDMTNPQGSNWWAEAIFAPNAWAYDEYFANTVRVGIADTGISKNHEDLTITETLSSYNTPRSHGTHVAGLIGATANNQKGMTGAAWNKAEIYNWDLYNGGSSMTNITTAIEKLIQSDCKVLNLSVGRVYTSPSGLGSMTSEGNSVASTVNNWAKNYDFLIFQSAGNGYDKPSSGTDYSAYGYDAVYNGTFCTVTNAAAKEHIAVIACAMQPQYSNDEAHPNDYHLTRWSCFGDQVTLASPGYGIYSTVYFKSNDGDDTLPGYTANSNGYTQMSGTSMASPIAAGCAALVWSVNPSLTAKEIKQILVDTAGVCYRNENNSSSTRVGHYYVGLDSRESYPFLNVEAAVEEALERTYGDGTLNVSFVNAKDNTPLSNVRYEVRLGSATGTVVAAGTANGSAAITLPRAQGTDYHQAQYYIVATNGHDTWTSATASTVNVGQTTNVTAALNVPDKINAYRVVLTWNAEPADLDAHLVAGNGGHVYYKAKSIPGAVMDLDDTQSFGPETITVTDVSALGGFTYSVHDFTNRATFLDASRLADSGATVRVYAGSALVKIYTVPANMNGTVWNVFSVDADGTITDGGAFKYSGNGAAIAGLFPVNSAATASALSAQPAWKAVEPDKS